MRRRCARCRAGTYARADVLDDDGFGASTFRSPWPSRLGGGRARVDFAGSAPQVRGPLNANYRGDAVGRALRLHARSIAKRFRPTRASLRPLAVRGARGQRRERRASRRPVAGGNVETSQRIVDVVLARAGARAAGAHPGRERGHDEQPRLRRYLRRRRARPAFAYYETIGGGAGARSARARVRTASTRT